MYKIVKKEILNPSVVLMDVYAPDIARSCESGQFIVLRIDEFGERIPLTIADYFPEEGTIRIVTQAVGYTSRKLMNMNQGDSFIDFIGPLGKESEIENYGTVLCICGGLGIAPMFPIARDLKKAGNKVITVMGARNKDLLIWEDVLKTVSDEVYVTTDDGSYGRKGLVTDVAKEILEREKVDKAWAIGPVIMMKFSSLLTEKYQVPTIVSMNPIMVDGTGMCGACRLEVGGKTKFACVDGPEFDAHEVNWDLSLRRMNIYKAKEELALAKAEKGGF
ncbi:MAG: sulfide/dihydroorotate dehydrogenase-like FAD/NAD-binding protein [Fusobacteria bacterium]|nr:sulfide/dihydroorotate dehydrogenase-like FAD/NAD-binding protein [Fusobacteriota bacterium]